MKRIFRFDSIKKNLTDVYISVVLGCSKCDLSKIQEKTTQTLKFNEKDASPCNKMKSRKMVPCHINSQNIFTLSLSYSRRNCELEILNGSKLKLLSYC